MSLDKLLNGIQTLAIVCNQWGDTGKGKFTEYFSSHWADVIARGTGGNNAGHTVIIDRNEKIFHLLPTGIVHDNLGKINILGNGMVIDIKILCQELDELNNEGKTYNNLIISKDAQVIMPYQIASDVSKNQSQLHGGIGSTGRGIGPCYTDKIARRGIQVEDLLNRDRLAKRIKKALEFYPEYKDGTDTIIDELMLHADRIKPFVRDSVSEMHQLYRQGKKILIEGAQGLLLSIEHGTYPYVTSSDCSLNGTASGVGLSARAIDLCLGMVKFPFMTRVGAGPFPTELGREKSELYCGDKECKKERELKEHEIEFDIIDGKIVYNKKHEKIIEMINSVDPFIQGVGIRLAAAEYGATTARPRRIGWTDAVSARYAVKINGPRFILTKADSLAGARKFNICYGYREDDSRYIDFNREEGFLRDVTPEYREYEGYFDISDAKEYDALPKSLKSAIEDFERFTQGKVAIVSIGAERDQTIVR